VTSAQEPDAKVRGAARKERTRSALVAAAQEFIAAGRTDVAVLDITKMAGVGLGSFYNHFDTKADLFETAVDEAAREFGDLVSRLAGGEQDPAVVVAQSFRLTGRYHRQAPVVSRSLIGGAAQLLSRGGWLVQQVRRNLANGVESGRFEVADIDLAVGTVLGATAMLGQRIHDHPELDDAWASDVVAADLLRMLGLTAEEAHQIAGLPLPDAAPGLGGHLGR